MSEENYGKNYNEEMVSLFKEEKAKFQALLEDDFTKFTDKYYPENNLLVEEFEYTTSDYVAEHLSNGSGSPTQHRPLMSGREINDMFSKELLADDNCYAMLISRSCNPEIHYIIGAAGDAWVAGRELGELNTIERINTGTQDRFNYTEFFNVVNEMYTVSNDRGIILESLEQNKWCPSDEYTDLLSAHIAREELGYDYFKDVLSDKIDATRLSVVDRNAFIKHMEDNDFKLTEALVELVKAGDFDSVKNDVDEGTEFRLVSKKELIDDFKEISFQLNDLLENEREFENAVNLFKVDEHRIADFDDKKVYAAIEKSFNPDRPKVDIPKIKTKFKP